MIEDLIAAYLFQNKSCPLPGAGSLSVGDRTASFVLGEKQLYPPWPYISFSPAERSAADFIKYVAVQKSISMSAAESLIQSYCTRLNNLDAYAEAEIPCAGKFYIDAEGSLVFKQVQFPESFLSPVTAERITHPEATHTIIVGDKESNSALMTEYYNEPGPLRKHRWGITAMVLVLVALTTILLYYFNHKSSIFGNATKSPVKTESSTYQVE